LIEKYHQSSQVGFEQNLNSYPDSATPEYE